MTVEPAANSASRTNGVASRPGAAVSAVVVAAGGVVGALCFVLVATSGTGDNADGHWFVQLAANLFTIGVGLVMWHVRPGNRVGPLVILMGFASTVDFLGFDNADSLAWTVGDMWNLLGFVVLANVYLVFPDGRTSPWSRRLAFAVYAWFFLLTVSQRLVYPYPGAWLIHNPFLLWPNEQLTAALGVIGNFGALVLATLVVGTVLDRWRRGSPVARRALAPVFWVSPITLVVVGTFFFAKVTNSAALFAVSTGPLAQLSNFLLPIAFLVGLLQTRLELGSIADLVRDLAGLRTGDLQAALARAVHDSSLLVAFPATDGVGYVDSDGRQVELPSVNDRRGITRIESSGRAIAVLVHDPGVDPALLASAAAASRLALENERLSAEVRAQLEEVRASRARIVEAGDAERHKVERDLHDGAQQRLVALTMRLEQARETAVGSADLIDQVTAELRAAVADVRSLARGLHPPILTEAGLGPAIETLAERTTIPVDVDVADGRFPPTVEATAYYVVAEALTNVTRHAGATAVRITATLGNNRLLLTIADDGQGGADPSRGSGLRGLADRVAASGGDLSVDSPPGGGTTIRAELPIP